MHAVAVDLTGVGVLAARLGVEGRVVQDDLHDVLGLRSRNHGAVGIGVKARAVIIFTGCFVATVLNTYTGVRSTDQTLINVAKTCGAGNFKTFCKVGIPSAMPMIFAGLKTSMGSAWGTIVAAEMLASSNGLGYMIQMGRSFGKVSLIMAGIIVIGILGFISSGLIDLAEGIVLKWRPKK